MAREIFFECDFDEAKLEQYGLVGMYPTLSHPARQDRVVRLAQFLDRLSPDATTVTNLVIKIPKGLVTMALRNNGHGLTARLIK